MKEPFDSILSNKSKKNKRNADSKSYFENTNDTLGLYKNPSLKSEEEEGEEDEDGKKLSGFSLLKKIYGGSNPCWNGYEQFGMKSKNGKQVPNCIPKKAGCNSCQTNKKVLNKVVDNYSDVVNHLEEHLKEKAGDPKDAKQSKLLKKEIKNINQLHLVPANKVPKRDPLYQFSNPKEVQKKAFEIYGKDGIVYKSDRANKKYQILNTLTGKWVHFGQMGYEDFTKHLDKQRQSSYLSRALNIKGNWRKDPYSPNTLSIMLLW